MRFFLYRYGGMNGPVEGNELNRLPFGREVPGKQGERKRLKATNPRCGSLEYANE